jgi:hypothetical protein
MGDVVEIFGVSGDLLEDAPSGFDVSQVLFALILAAALVDEAVLSPDAFQGTMAEGEIELADETAGAEGGKLLAESYDLLFQGQRRFTRLMVGSAGESDQTARSLLLIAAQPLAHGGYGGLKQPGRGFDAVLASRLNQTQAMIVSVAHFADQGEVGSRHGGGL